MLKPDMRVEVSIALVCKSFMLYIREKVEMKMKTNPQLRRGLVAKTIHFWYTSGMDQYDSVPSDKYGRSMKTLPTKEKITGAHFV